MKWQTKRLHAVKPEILLACGSFCAASFVKHMCDKLPTLVGLERWDDFIIWYWKYEVSDNDQTDKK